MEISQENLKTKTRENSLRICLFQTVNLVFSKDDHERLRKRVNQVRPDIADKWILHHTSQLYFYLRSFDLKRDFCSTASLYTWSESCFFLQNWKMPFGCHLWNKKNDWQFKAPTSWNISALLPRLRITTPPVNSCRRELPSRRQYCCLKIIKTLKDQFHFLSYIHLYYFYIKLCFIEKNIYLTLIKSY